jgi:hypothetical protein
MNIPVIVTSYKRPLYLEACLRSMRQSKGIEIIVVDGGDIDSNTEGPFAPAPDIADICSVYADYVLSVPGNPGADVLKNQGILRGVLKRGDALVPPYFVVSSDDLQYPEGWFEELVDQWLTIRDAGKRTGVKYGMMACPTRMVIEHHTFEPGAGPGGSGMGYHYQPAKGSTLEIMTTSVSMVSGAMMDTAAVAAIGGFPVYGRSGQGDIAISKEFRARKFEVGYFKRPMLEHIGQTKHADYPAYSAAFDTDDAVWQQRAREHQIGQRRGFDWPSDLPGDAL